MAVTKVTKAQFARAATIAGTGALLGVYGIAGLADHGRAGGGSGGMEITRTAVTTRQVAATSSPTGRKRVHRPQRVRRATPAATRSSVAVKATRTWRRPATP